MFPSKSSVIVLLGTFAVKTNVTRDTVSTFSTDGIKHTGSWLGCHHDVTSCPPPPPPSNAHTHKGILGTKLFIANQPGLLVDPNVPIAKDDMLGPTLFKSDSSDGSAPLTPETSA